MNKNREDNAVKTAPQTQKPDRNGGSTHGSAQQTQRQADVNPQNRPQSAPGQADKTGEKLDVQPQKRS